MRRAARGFWFALGLGLFGAGVRQAAALTVNCTVTAGSINFGIYNPLAGVGDASTGALRVVCTGNGGGSTNVTVGVSLTAGSSGNYATRTMQSGANKLAYNIYWDPQHTVVMGDGTGGSYSGTAGPITIINGRSIQATGTMYGFVPSGQDVGAGSYIDIITVTVTY